jgi:hypothetical protein
MGGAMKVLNAPTLEELKAMVEEWYAQAAAQRLDDERLPSSEAQARQESDGSWSFSVWAHA